MKSTKEKVKKKSKNDPSKKNKKLPGEYPPQEDIMNPKNGFERIDADIEDLNDDGLPKEEKIVNAGSSSSSSSPAVTDNKSNLTKDDLMALGDINQSNDLGDDEQLKDRAIPVDFSASDMDVPGSELDDQPELNGSEDEENNSYSLDKQEN